MSDDRKPVSGDEGNDNKDEKQPKAEPKSIGTPKISFDERGSDLSAKVKDKSDEEVLDFILNSEDDEFLPWEPVTLPSRGAYYGSRVPDGVVQVRPMNIYVERILSTSRFARTGRSMEMMMKHCVRFPDQSFDPTELLVGDSSFLIYYLRGITYGNEYEFMATCDNDDCGAKMMKTFDLNDLARSIKYASPSDREPLEIKLPHMSKTLGRDIKIKVRFMRRYDLTTMMEEEQIERRVRPAGETKQLSMDPDDMIERNLSLITQEVMGDSDRSKIDAFVSKLHSKDSSYIRESIEKKSPGMDTSIKIKCDTCGNSMEVSLPLTESFFRGKVREEAGE